MNTSCALASRCRYRNSPHIGPVHYRIPHLRTVADYASPKQVLSKQYTPRVSGDVPTDTSGNQEYERMAMMVFGSTNRGAEDGTGLVVMEYENLNTVSMMYV